jgi:hypothetical protein
MLVFSSAHRTNSSRPQFTALPDALIEIQEPAGLLFEVWVSRKNPATVLPRADGVLMEPAPDGGIADGGQTRVAYMRSKFGDTPTGEWCLGNLGELTDDGLNAHDEFWGEPGAAPGVGDLLDRPDVFQRIAFATC